MGTGERISRRAVVRASEDAMGVATRVLELHKEFAAATEEEVDRLRDELRDVMRDLEDELKDRVTFRDFEEKTDELEDEVKTLGEDMTRIGDRLTEFCHMTLWQRLQWIATGKLG